MGKILVPVDLSDCTENNCLLGLNLAQKIKADLHLLHCYNDIKIPDLLKSREEFVELDNEIMLTEEEAEERLSMITEGLESRISSMGLDNVSVKKSIVKSYPSREVVKQCKELKPDLLLLSTSSVGDRVKKVLGSLTYHILTSVNVPVLSIPDDSDIDLSKELNLCLVCDFKECELDTIHKLLKLVSGFNIKITLLHVGDVKDDDSKLASLNNFKAFIKGKYDDLRYSIEFIEIEDKVSGIIEYAELKKIDIISLTTGRRNFFRKMFNTDLTKSLFFDLNKPLLVFHS